MRYIISLIICLYTNSYILFPIEYLPEHHYKFDHNNIHQEIMQKIYFKKIITNLSIGTPHQKISLFIEANDEQFYLTSYNESPSVKNKEYYSFNKNEFYQEIKSSSSHDINCNNVSSIYPYKQICYSKDIISMNINTINSQIEFPIQILKEYNQNIPGSIGLIYNESLYSSTKSFTDELKEQNLIHNYNWFFNIEEFSPYNNKLKGHLIIEQLPHEIFPKKFHEENLKTTNSYKTTHAGKSWRLYINKIFVNNQDDIQTLIKDRIVTFEYGIYNIIATMEFHNIFKKLIMDILINDNICYKGNFTQNIHKNFNLTFYYCKKEAKMILFQYLPNINFFSPELNFTFEINSNELYYEKDNYIYFMILFSPESITNWIIGQMLLLKYNFIFNIDKKQIGIYNKIFNDNGDISESIGDNDDSKDMPMAIIIILTIICSAFVFIVIGILIGRKIFGKKKKKLANVLEDDDYEYHQKDEIIN